MYVGTYLGCLEDIALSDKTANFNKSSRYLMLLFWCTSTKKSYLSVQTVQRVDGGAGGGPPGGRHRAAREPGRAQVLAGPRCGRGPKGRHHHL